MKSFLPRALLVAAALALAACSESSIDDFSAKASKELPARILSQMKAKGMERTSPIMARVFKEEGQLEIWKQKLNGRYDLIATYNICKWSGKLGPKYIEGDRQAPEGFYSVSPAQMNPRSNYHLAFNIGYPNAYDRANGRTGSNLMVHGACSSSGCYSMTDAQIEEIYAFGRDAFQGGQRDFQVQSFPFRMTAANMARYRNDPNYPFWKMLKEGYDYFEITKVPPKVDVCEKRYVFNRIPVEGARFDPAGACPAFTQPDTLRSAYQSYQSKFDSAFSEASALASGTPPRSSINGLSEARLVAEWTKKRARGERIPIEPPSMASDGTVSETSRMGRIDSEVGRRMAAADAAKEAKRKAEEEKAAAKLAKALPVQAAAPQPNPAAQPAPAPQPETASAEAANPGMLGGVRRRFANLFGG